MGGWNEVDATTPEGSRCHPAALVPWLLERARGPIAVFDRHQGSIVFPRSGIAFDLADIRTIECVHGWLVQVMPGKGRSHIRQRQIFIQIRDENNQPVYIIAHGQSDNIARGLEAFAREINIPFAEHRLSMKLAKRIE